jgi:hypothetical protein
MASSSVLISRLTSTAEITGYSRAELQSPIRMPRLGKEIRAAKQVLNPLKSVNPYSPSGLARQVQTTQALTIPALTFRLTRFWVNTAPLDADNG